MYTIAMNNFSTNVKSLQPHPHASSPFSFTSTSTSTVVVQSSSQDISPLPGLHITFFGCVSDGFLHSASTTATPSSFLQRFLAASYMPFSSTYVEHFTILIINTSLRDVPLLHNLYRIALPTYVFQLLRCNSGLLMFALPSSACTYVPVFHFLSILYPTLLTPVRVHFLAHCVRFHFRFLFSFLTMFLLLLSIAY